MLLIENRSSSALQVATVAAHEWTLAQSDASRLVLSALGIDSPVVATATWKHLLTNGTLHMSSKRSEQVLHDATAGKSECATRFMHIGVRTLLLHEAWDKLACQLEAIDRMETAGMVRGECSVATIKPIQLVTPCMMFVEPCTFAHDSGLLTTCRH
jgi:hypothetical protein